MFSRRPLYRRTSSTEVFSARRLSLQGTYTTAASLLNSVLQSTVEHQVQESGHGGGGKGGEEASAGDSMIHRHRMAIALYYLAIDESARSNPSDVAESLSSVTPSEDKGFGKYGFDTLYHKHLRQVYPRLFASGLLQEMILFRPSQHGFEVEVYTHPTTSRSNRPIEVSQYFDDSASHAKETVFISHKNEVFPYLSPVATLESQTSILTFPLPTHSPQHHRVSLSTSQEASPHPTTIQLRVPCYPLLLIEEAHSAAQFVKSIREQDVEVVPSSHFAPSLQHFLLKCRNTGNRTHSMYDLQSMIKFFNVSLVVQLRHLVHPSHPFDFSNKSFEIYARFFMSDKTKQVVEDTLEVFKKFDLEFAELVAKEDAKWPRWIETTSDDDHVDVFVEDAARRKMGEWKEVIELLTILAETKSLAAHVPVARKKVEENERRKSL